MRETLGQPEKYFPGKMTVPELYRKKGSSRVWCATGPPFAFEESKPKGLINTCQHIHGASIWKVCDSPKCHKEKVVHTGHLWKLNSQWIHEDTHMLQRGYRVQQTGSEAGFVRVKMGRFILLPFQMRLHCSGVDILKGWHLWQSRGPSYRQGTRAATRCEPDAKRNSYTCSFLSKWISIL